MFLVTRTFNQRKNMKKIFIIAAVCLLHTLSATAAGKVGQCVFPKTKVAKNGNLEWIKPVHIASAPNATNTQILKSLSAFTINAEAKGYIQLATVPDYDKPDPEKYAGKIVGWAKLSDFNFLDLRNCN